MTGFICLTKEDLVGHSSHDENWSGKKYNGRTNRNPPPSFARLLKNSVQDKGRLDRSPELLLCENSQKVFIRWGGERARRKKK